MTAPLVTVRPERGARNPRPLVVRAWPCTWVRDGDELVLEAARGCIEIRRSKAGEDLGRHVDDQRVLSCNIGDRLVVSASVVAIAVLLVVGVLVPGPWREAYRCRVVAGELGAETRGHVTPGPKAVRR